MSTEVAGVAVLVVTMVEMTLATVFAAAMAVMTGAVMMATAMVEAAVKAVVMMVMVAVVEMKIGFLSKSPPQLPSVKHSAFAPATMLILLTQART